MSNTRLRSNFISSHHPESKTKLSNCYQYIQNASALKVQQINYLTKTTINFFCENSTHVKIIYSYTNPWTQNKTTTNLFMTGQVEVRYLINPTVPYTWKWNHLHFFFKILYMHFIKAKLPDKLFNKRFIFDIIGTHLWSIQSLCKNLISWTHTDHSLTLV